MGQSNHIKYDSVLFVMTFQTALILLDGVQTWQQEATLRISADKVRCCTNVVKHWEMLPLASLDRYASCSGHKQIETQNRS